MYENANFSIETEKETITELHQLDMEFCTIAMWIPSLRDVISRHLYSFIYKGSASNKEQSTWTSRAQRKQQQPTYQHKQS